jgi:hypothetical protein
MVAERDFARLYSTPDAPRSYLIVCVPLLRPFRQMLHDFFAGAACAAASFTAPKTIEVGLHPAAS